jgi:2-polyprenyl-3-methyl-5-hydroxy-6-metoxy-1,4-benzoquinol methylase
MIDSKGAAVKDLYEACLVTAVADPQGVRATAMAAGVNVLCEKLFPDHHKFKAEEIKEIERTSKLPLLVTEKDAVKLFDLGLTNFFILRVDVEIRGPLLEVALARISGKTRQAAEQSLEASPLKRQKLAQLRRVSRDLHGKILDLGSDNGAVSFALRRLGGDWQTGDLDSEVIAGASYFLGDSVREINPSKLQFLNAELDAVVVLDMFEHLQDDKALRDELLRVLKPGGQLIVNVPNPHIGLIRLLRTILGQTDKVHGHVRPGYTPDELKKVLGPEFNIEVVLEYSRAFTELADTLVTLGVDLLKSAKRSSAKGRVVSAGNLTAFRKTIKLGRLVAPLLNLAVLFDYLLPWTHTNLLIVRARKL